MKLPQGSNSPKLLQLLAWIATPLDYLDNCAKKYGNMFTVRFVGFKPLVFINHPQAIQQIFSSDSQKFDSGRSNTLIKALLGDKSIILLDGDRHKRERKLLMPPFHGEKVKSYAQLICQITEKVASQWKVDKPFLARNAMQEITLEVILNTIFGISEGDRYQKLKPLLADFLDATNSPIRASLIFIPFLQQDWGKWSPWGKVVYCKREIERLLQEEIDQRKSNSQQSGNDVLSLMLAARDEKGEPMSDEELRDEMLTLLVAGHETTATALAWAFYWLDRYPQVRAKLLAEIDGLGENPDLMEIYRLPYLTAVCQEILRIYPVGIVTFSRITKSPIEIMGHKFEANTWLVPCIYSIHHREDLYPNPKKFKPERFIDRSYSPYEYLPFGGGNRLCLGYALAMLEMKLVIATLFSRYNFASADNKPVQPQRRGGTIAPHNGVPIMMTGMRTNIMKGMKDSIMSR
jgi:cytochrome P450 family 110